MLHGDDLVCCRVVLLELPIQLEVHLHSMSFDTA